MSRKREREAKKATRQTDSAVMCDGFIGTDNGSRRNITRRQKKINFSTVSD